MGVAVLGLMRTYYDLLRWRFACATRRDGMDAKDTRHLDGRRCPSPLPRWCCSGWATVAALKAGERLPPLVSLRVALGLPDRGPEGRILVVTTRQGPVGFLVDEVVQVLEIDPTATRVRENRLGSGYVVGTVEALGGTWLLVDWDAIRLPGALRSTR